MLGIQWCGQQWRWMMMRPKHRTNAIALVAVGVFAVACADPTTPSVAPLPSNVSNSIVQEIIDYQANGGFPEGLFDGNVRVCKRVQEDDPGGTFSFNVAVLGGGSQTYEITVPAGGINCRIVYTSTVLNAATPEVLTVTENTSTNWSLVDINTRRLLTLVIFSQGGYTAAHLADAENVGDRRASLVINSDMARIVTFVNDFVAPPLAVCDFMTFGRLVVEVNGQKVVISGNVGGLNANSTIKSEFHVEANDVDNHVAQVDTYGPISGGPLAGLSNSRVTTGTAKNGVDVELRLWDSGEPGGGADRVYVKLNGVELLGPNGQLIDQGNIQYHSNCRGPG